MKYKKYIWKTATILLISLSIISCKQKVEKKAEIYTTSTKAIPVKTMTIKKEIVNFYIEYTANLIPFKEVHLAPASPGRIEKIYVDIGDYVKEGQIVAMMNRTNLEQAKINLLKLEADFKRVDTLIKTKSISEQQYDQIKSAYELAKTSYEYLLENTLLKSPFTGVISGKYFQEGEIYSGTPVSSIGKPAILSIVQINDLKAIVNISSIYYPLIKEKQEAEIFCELYPKEKFMGEIYKIYPVIANTTKTFGVELKIHNPNLLLRPGMFIKIKLNIGKGEALLIPISSLIKQTGTNNMYVYVNKNNIAHKVFVKTGSLYNDKIQILEGLHENDEIVTNGQNKLNHLIPIEVHNE